MVVMPGMALDHEVSTMVIVGALTVPPTEATVTVPGRTEPDVPSVVAAWRVIPLTMRRRSTPLSSVMVCEVSVDVDLMRPRSRRRCRE